MCTSPAAFAWSASSTCVNYQPRIRSDSRGDSQALREVLVLPDAFAPAPGLRQLASAASEPLTQSLRVVVCRKLKPSRAWIAGSTFIINPSEVWLHRRAIPREQQVVTPVAIPYSLGKLAVSYSRSSTFKVGKTRQPLQPGPLNALKNTCCRILSGRSFGCWLRLRVYGQASVHLWHTGLATRGQQALGSSNKVAQRWFFLRQPWPCLGCGC